MLRLLPILALAALVLILPQLSLGQSTSQSSPAATATATSTPLPPTNTPTATPVPVVCPPVATTTSFTVVGGTVTFDNNRAPVNTEITAVFSGTTIGCFVVTTAGQYRLDVYGNDGTQPSYPSAGQTFSLLVNGQPVTSETVTSASTGTTPAGTYQNGNLILTPNGAYIDNLTAFSPTPTPTVTNTPTATNTSAPAQPTATNTSAPAQPTATNTSAPAQPTATNTSAPAQPTATNTPGSSSGSSPSSSNPSATNTSTPVTTAVATTSATETPAATPTSSAFGNVPAGPSGVGATVTGTLPPTVPGGTSQLVIVTLPQGVPVAVKVTITSEPAASLLSGIVSPLLARIPPGAEAIIVRAIDANGNPVPNTPVQVTLGLPAGVTSISQLSPIYEIVTDQNGHKTLLQVPTSQMSIVNGKLVVTGTTDSTGALILVLGATTGTIPSALPSTGGGETTLRLLLFVAMLALAAFGGLAARRTIRQLR